jgi:hypothetical protein
MSLLYRISSKFASKKEEAVTGRFKRGWSTCSYENLYNNIPQGCYYPWISMMMAFPAAAIMGRRRLMTLSPMTEYLSYMETPAGE